MNILGFKFGKDRTTIATSVSNKTEPAKGNKSEYSATSLADYNFTTSTLIERYHSKGWITFGADNLLPQFLNEMYHSSPLHSSIINFKKLATIGDGITTNKQHLKGQELIDYTQMTLFFDGEKSVEETIEAITMDYFLHNRIIFLVTWNADNTKIIKRKRLAPDTVRVGREDSNGCINNYYVCRDWQFMNGTDNKVYCYPKFDPNNKAQKEQVFSYSVPTPGLKYYAVPSYFPAINSMKTDAQIPNFQRAQLKNGVFGSWIVTHHTGIPTQEEQDMYLQKFNDFYQGTDNADKVFHQFVDGKEYAPTISSLSNNNNDTRFLEMQNSAQKSILLAHSTAPIILGFQNVGSLGSGMELGIAFENFYNVNIYPARKVIESIINKFYQINGLYVDLKITDAKQLQTATK